MFQRNSDFLAEHVPDHSPGLSANIYYFNHPDWAQEYLTHCHRSDSFRRWTCALGDLNDKIVMDIGCGPGNLFATISERPKLLIGVDMAQGSLDLAEKSGYTPVLADASRLPFLDGFADIVTMNATLHHVEDMEAVLKEAARIVKPGGLLITDHDPQKSSLNYKGLAKLAWDFRIWLYRKIGYSFHKTKDQQYWGLACEIHHIPGDGVSKELFKTILEPAGFEVKVYPHHHELGTEIFEGERGTAPLKYRLANLFSGRNPASEQSALSLMCIAKKM